jgi:hypothetical protein
VNRLDAGAAPFSAGTPDQTNAGTRRAAPAPQPPALPDSASAGAATDNLRALAETLGIDPADLLAQLTAAGAGPEAPPADPEGPPDGGAAPSPAAAAAAALLNRDHPANAWTGDLTQHRGGLLVDISV